MANDDIVRLLRWFYESSKQRPKPQGIDGQFYEAFCHLADGGFLVSAEGKTGEDYEQERREDFERLATYIFLVPHFIIRIGSLWPAYLSNSALSKLNTTYVVPGLTARTLLFEKYVYEVFLSWFGFEIDDVNVAGRLLETIAALDSSLAIERHLDEVEGHRDHVLHLLNVFMLGIWLFLNKPFLQKSYEAWLQSKGCKASELEKPPKTLLAQFVPQWFITTMMHDIARVPEDAGPDLRSKQLSAVVEKANDTLIAAFATQPKLATISVDPLTLDPNNKFIVLGKLLSIDYPFSRRVPGDMFEEAKTELDKLSSQYADDHGLNSAKLLLKVANLVAKVNELVTRDKWDSFICRQYVLPVYAIARHNLASLKELVGIHETVDGATAEKGSFQSEFLTSMLMLCDEAQRFDRIGDKFFKLGADHFLKLDQTDDSLKIHIVELS